MVASNNGNAVAPLSLRIDTGQGPKQRSTRQDTKGNAATGVSAAGVRAISSQLVAFYFRAPVKAFFRTRIEAINPRVQANERWSWRMSSAGLLTHAVRVHGWGFILNQLFPPLLANVSVGAVLYTSYLQLLGRLYRPSSETAKRTYPPPPPERTFAAGFAAGAVQSVVAAPLDALSVRFKPNDILEGRYKNVWHYGYLKMREVGVRGMLAGWGISFFKDSLGYGLFFATFEYVKGQSYYAFVTRNYGGLDWQNLPADHHGRTIKPHYAIEPSFLMVAGISASVAQQEEQTFDASLTNRFNVSERLPEDFPAVPGPSKSSRRVA
ncbi:MAG: hypothetical protein Q9181_003587 [Wetmoreana brouardii]